MGFLFRGFGVNFISMYRNPAGGEMPHEHKVYNEAMKKPRVTVENAIGFLKARLPFLCNIQMQIRGYNNGNCFMLKICEYVQGAVILHNLLTKRNDVIPEE